MQEGAV
jgi:hypothetical protein